MKIMEIVREDKSPLEILRGIYTSALQNAKTAERTRLVNRAHELAQGGVSHTSDAAGVKEVWDQAMDRAREEQRAARYRHQRRNQDREAGQRPAQPAPQTRQQPAAKRSSSAPKVSVPGDLDKAVKSLPGVSVADKYIKMGQSLANLFKENRQDDK